MMAVYIFFRVEFPNWEDDSGDMCAARVSDMDILSIA